MAMVIMTAALVSSTGPIKKISFLHVSVITVKFTVPNYWNMLVVVVWEHLGVTEIGFSLSVLANFYDG